MRPSPASPRPVLLLLGLLLITLLASEPQAAAQVSAAQPGPHHPELLSDSSIPDHERMAVERYAAKSGDIHQLSGPLNETFASGALNPDIWRPSTIDPPVYSFLPGEPGLVLRSRGKPVFVESVFLLQGDFTIQAEYELREWPRLEDAEAGAGLVLFDAARKDGVALGRVQALGEELMGVSLILDNKLDARRENGERFSGQQCALRLERRDGRLRTWYRENGQWKELGRLSQPMPEALRLLLVCHGKGGKGGKGGGGAVVRFTSVRVKVLTGAAAD